MSAPADFLSAGDILADRNAGSSSDEPQLLDHPPPPPRTIKPKSFRAGPSKSRAKKGINGDTIISNASDRSLQPKVSTESRGKAKTTIRNDEDDDEPVFVGSTVATDLAEKYSYKLSSSSYSSPLSPPKRKASPTPAPPPLPLFAPVSPPKKPIAVPVWLGRTAVLLQLPDCVVCRKRWKKSDSGAARWVRLYLSPGKL